MAEQEIKNCKFRSRAWRGESIPCNLTSKYDELCDLHRSSSNPRMKDSTELLKQVATFQQRYGRAILEKMHFVGAHDLNDILASNIGNPALIVECTLDDDFEIHYLYQPSNEVLFDQCIFNGHVQAKQGHFGRAQSSNAQVIRFEGCTFRGICDLVFPTTYRLCKSNTFQKDTYIEYSFDNGGGSATLVGCNFLGTTRIISELMAGTNPEITRDIQFKKCDLSGLIVSDIRKHFNYLNVHTDCKWPRSRIFSTLQFGTILIEDERRQSGRLVNRLRFVSFMADKFPYLRFDRSEFSAEVTTAEECVQTYSFLEKYYHSREMYELAGQFYCGAMRTQRLLHGTTRSTKILSVLFQLLSNFGYSIWRPLVSSFIIHFLFTVFYMNNGWKVPSVADDKIGFSQFMHCFTSTLVGIAGDRTQPYMPDAGSYLRIVLLMEGSILIALLAFLLIAVRRRFVPKKLQSIT